MTEPEWTAVLHKHTHTHKNTYYRYILKHSIGTSSPTAGINMLISQKALTERSHDTQRTNFVVNTP